MVRVPLCSHTIDYVVAISDILCSYMAMLHGSVVVAFMMVGVYVTQSRSGATVYHALYCIRYGLCTMDFDTMAMHYAPCLIR